MELLGLHDKDGKEYKLTIGCEFKYEERCDIYNRAYTPPVTTKYSIIDIKPASLKSKELPKTIEELHDLLYNFSLEDKYSSIHKFLKEQGYKVD